VLTHAHKRCGSGRASELAIRLRRGASASSRWKVLVHAPASKADIGGLFELGHECALTVMRSGVGRQRRMDVDNTEGCFW